jgi:hypothetical protein
MSTLPASTGRLRTPAYEECREILHLLERAKRGEAITDEEIQRLREYRDRLLLAANIVRARLNP